MYCLTYHSAFANDSEENARIFLEKKGLLDGPNGNDIFVSVGTGSNFFEAFCEGQRHLSEFINVKTEFELNKVKNINESKIEQNNFKSTSSIKIGSDYKITVKSLTSKSENWNLIIKIEYLKNYLICNYDQYNTKISFKGEITEMLNYLKNIKSTQFIYFNSYKKDQNFPNYQVTILQIFYTKKF